MAIARAVVNQAPQETKKDTTKITTTTQDKGRGVVSQVNVAPAEQHTNSPIIKDINEIVDKKVESGGGGSGRAEWGFITGEILHQIDLQSEFQNVREVAEGKCKSYVLSSEETAPATDEQAQRLKKPDGTSFTSLQEFEDYVAYEDETGICINSGFGVDTALIVEPFNYFITNDNIVHRYIDGNGDQKQFGLKTGDIVLVEELEVPDRWFDYSNDEFHILETTKVDLSNYYTKAQIDNSFQIPTYEITLTTISGGITDEQFEMMKTGICLIKYNNNKYTTFPAVQQPGNENLFMGSYVTYGNVQGEFGRYLLDTREGYKEMAFSVGLGVDTTRVDFRKPIRMNGKVITDTGSINPKTNNTSDLGTSAVKWKDFYLSGNISDGTNIVSVADIAKKGYVILSDHTQFASLTGGELYNCVSKGCYIPTFAPINGNQRQNISIYFTNIAGNQYKVNGTFMDASRNTILYEGNVSGIVDGSASNVSYSNFTEIKLADIGNLITYAKTQGWIS